MSMEDIPKTQMTSSQNTQNVCFVVEIQNV